MISPLFQSEDGLRHELSAVVAGRQRNGWSPLLSSRSDIQRSLQELRFQGEERAPSLTERIAVARECLRNVADIAEHWVDISGRIKQGDTQGAVGAEEFASGPLSTLRYLQLLIRTLTSIRDRGTPTLPGPVTVESDGRVHVPVFPARGLYDSLLLYGFQAWTWLPAGTDPDRLFARLPHWMRLEGSRAPVLAALSAGNISSIPAVDALGAMLQEGKRVLLKMSPVNAALGPLFEDALAPCIDAGWLRVAYGGPEAGAAAVTDPLTDEIHITGSIRTHDDVMWGPAGTARLLRQRSGAPVLHKPVSSELGNVTPWIFVPGEYSDRQLEAQAENIAGSVIANAGFNCVATRVLLTWKRWPGRESLLNRIQHIFSTTPTRSAWYPGALDRYQALLHLDAAHVATGHLPWTLLRGMDVSDMPEFFNSESFIPVLAEVPLEARNEADFLVRAVEFANHQIWGTLAVGMSLPQDWNDTLGGQVFYQQALRELRYGLIGVNQWPGLMHSMMSVPWGAAPGSPLTDAQSGSGFSHNAYCLDRIEKTVMEGPLTIIPKPFWLPTHKSPVSVARQMCQLYADPATWRLPGLLAAAFREELP